MFCTVGLQGNWQENTHAGKYSHDYSNNPFSVEKKNENTSALRESWLSENRSHTYVLCIRAEQLIQFLSQSQYGLLQFSFNLETYLCLVQSTAQMTPYSFKYVFQ